MTLELVDVLRPGSFTFIRQSGTMMNVDTLTLRELYIGGF